MDILLFFLGAIIAAVLVYLLLKAKSVPKKQFDELNTKYIKIQSDLENNIVRYNEISKSLSSEIEIQKSLNEKKQSAENEVSLLKFENQTLKQSLETQKEEIKKLYEQAGLQFEKLANQILEEKTEKFVNVNKNNIDSLLKPLNENIEHFRKRINEVYDNEARERISLHSTIKIMMEQTNRISQEANNLASALKGQSKMQGDWGEMILERILEQSGLSKDREYYIQYGFKNEEGKNQRPDFIIKLPSNKIIIIDSKVSLNAYEKFHSSENTDDQKTYLDLHISSIKKHINDLSKKRYDNISESLDFTIMFIPIEPAYILALHHDHNLWNEAYSKHIILVSPTNLIASLKLISNLWKREYQNQNAIQIAEQGAKLYDKFVGFVDNLEKVGKNIEQAKKTYDDAYKQLCSGNGNLIKQSQELKNKGITNKKDFSQTLINKSENNFQT